MKQNELWWKVWKNFKLLLTSAEVLCSKHLSKTQWNKIGSFFSLTSTAMMSEIAHCFEWNCSARCKVKTIKLYIEENWNFKMIQSSLTIWVYCSKNLTVSRPLQLWLPTIDFHSHLKTCYMLVGLLNSSAKKWTSVKNSMLFLWFSNNTEVGVSWILLRIFQSTCQVKHLGIRSYSSTSFREGKYWCLECQKALLQPCIDIWNENDKKPNLKVSKVSNTFSQYNRSKHGKNQVL